MKLSSYSVDNWRPRALGPGANLRIVLIPNSPELYTETPSKPLRLRPGTIPRYDETRLFRRPDYVDFLNRCQIRVTPVASCDQRCVVDASCDRIHVQVLSFSRQSFNRWLLCLPSVLRRLAESDSTSNS